MMESIAGNLEGIFTQSILSNYPQIGANNESRAIIRPSSHADYQCNSAMALAQKLKKQGVEPSKTNPKVIAENLIHGLPSNEFIDEVQSSGGFINITLKSSFVNQKILNMLKNGIHVACDRQERVVIDYSSPNIAKEMHVGHLRSTIIGDCIGNILEFLGHQVFRVNHVGDWGTQFGMLLANLTEKYPDFVENPPAIGDLQKFYQEAKKRFDEEEAFQKKSKECVVKLQKRDPVFYKAWQLICSISRKEFQVLYNILGIKNLEEKGESYYQDMMEEMIKELKSKGLVVEEEGRLVIVCLDPEDPKTQKLIEKDKDGNEKRPLLTLVKSGGGFTYDTSDLACIRYRINETKADRIIYVTDKGQTNHFMFIFTAAKIAGYLDPNRVRVDHVSFGVVQAPGGKRIKTRSGDTIRLKDLIDEGLERAEAKLKEKGRDKELTKEEFERAKKAVAIGCIKYSDLATDRIKDYEFSFDRMLDDRGNTAVYLLYCLARTRSIIRKANLDKPIDELIKTTDTLKLSHIRELRLAKNLLKFPEIILNVSDTLKPHELCGYLFDLSVVFSEFYEECYCIEKLRVNDEDVLRVNFDRLLLCEATARIISLGLTLMGIELVEKL